MEIVVNGAFIALALLWPIAVVGYVLSRGDKKEKYEDGEIYLRRKDDL